MIPSLSEDLSRIILSKLPVDSLLRFKCVSKSWNSLIKDPYFIKQQLNQTIEDNNFTLMFDLVSTRNVTYSIECNVTASTNSLVIDALPLVPDTNLTSPVTISGSCNGLALLTDMYRSMEVWNPATGDCIRMSMPNGDDARASHINRLVLVSEAYGLGYDVNKDDYKVIVIRDYVGIGYWINSNPDSSDWLREVYVYSLKSQTWRTVEVEIPCTLLSYDGKYLNGFVYWIGGYIEHPSHRWTIVSFDFGSEKCEVIPMPDGCGIGLGAMLPAFNLLQWKGCLCLYFGESASKAVIYVMKEKVWSTVCRISSEAGTELHGFNFSEGRCVCFTNDGKILLQNVDRGSELLLLYDPETRRGERPVIHGVPSQFAFLKFYLETYMKSLVEVNTNNVRATALKTPEKPQASKGRCISVLLRRWITALRQSFRRERSAPERAIL